MAAPGGTTIGTARRWTMLAASTLAQGAAAVMIHGPAFLIPALHDRAGLSLPEAGVVAAAPTVGVMLTLVLWGLVVDRRGERFVLLTGLGATALVGAAATFAGGTVLLALALLLAGAAAASTGSASGRVVVGWFPPERRGLAMGIRQMAQPAGVGIAAVSIAVVAERHGIAAALWVPTVAAALAALVVAAVVVDPPRPDPRTERSPNPYLADSYLARIHGVSVLLVVPQFLVWTFAFAWLVQERGWSAAAAGSLVAGAQVAGALGRIAAGWLSDVVGARMRPLRWVAVAAGASMGLLGVAAGLDAAVAVPLVVVATVITVADNGLAFTAVAERSGPSWSGRALGVQNTAQYLTASAVPPLAGAVVATWGYAAAFAAAAVLPVLAAPLVPVAEERELA
ncbi:MFS transporter [Nocardioides sp. SOB77]|uniref:MFS transporter n=1 Tax=Nocardioides oceani TaxID=3058369 RepID=A0ABT8FFW0_9ACTN|nr:MFS transporter [Nocardioides oceani]MDN4173409.1 MFS transporter [Nocardioides oceani]